VNGPLEWFAAIGAMTAAALIAADLGRKVTGWAFVLFCAVSVAWVIAGLTGGGAPLTIQNAILLFINLFGVWQYLLSPRNRRKLEKMEQLEKEAEAQTGQ